MWCNIRIDIFCLFLLIQIVSGQLIPHDFATEEQLRTQIFTTNAYNKNMRPYNKTDIWLLLSLYTLKNIDVKQELMESSVFASIMWPDSRFYWQNNPTYSSLSKIYVKPADVWTPSIMIINSVDDMSIIGDKDVPITVSATGFLLWTFGISTTTNCNGDVTYYPFDTQSCDISFQLIGIANEHGELSFTPYTDNLEINYFRPNGEWDFVGNSTSIYSKTVKGFTVRTLNYIFKFRRRPLFHVINSLIPVTLFSSLSCAIFKVPADSGEKVGFCLTVLLGFAVYLTILTDFIPSTSIFTSYLSVYLVVVLSFSVISVIITILVLRCHHQDPETPISKRTKWFVRRVLLPFTCNKKCCCCRRCGRNKCKDSTTLEKTSEGYVEKEIKHKEKELTWQYIGQIIDQAGFILMVGATVLMTISIYAILLHGYNIQY